MQLAGKVAIVTGAGSGIGQATAKCFAKEGSAVIAVDWNKETAEKTVAAVRSKGGKAEFCFADVSKAEDVRRTVDTALTSFGALHILVNDAAIQIMAKLVDTTEAMWDQIHAVNLKGVFLGCKYAIPPMIDAGGGAIINKIGRAHV